VQVAEVAHDGRAGAEHEVVRVGEDALRAGGGDVIGQDALDRPLRPDRHERGVSKWP
jgi:hypothetical protein